MSKKKFVSPMQLQILTAEFPFRPSGSDEVKAEPNPFLDEEEEIIILPDGGEFVTNGEDVIIAPEVPSDFSSNTDEAYY